MFRAVVFFYADVKISFSFDSFRLFLANCFLNDRDLSILYGLINISEVLLLPIFTDLTLTLLTLLLSVSLIQFKIDSLSSLMFMKFNCSDSKYVVALVVRVFFMKNRFNIFTTSR